MQRTADATQLAADIVSAYVGHNCIPAAELISLIATVYQSIKTLSAGEQKLVEGPRQEPAVPIKKSITPEYLISLENGRKYKSLKRHLASAYSLTPDQYREKWGLAHDYPMVAPNYAAQRSKLAKQYGLGRIPTSTTKKKMNPNKSAGAG